MTTNNSIEKIKVIFNELAEASAKATEEIIDELKRESQTYGQVKEKLNRIKSDIAWSNMDIAEKVYCMEFIESTKRRLGNEQDIISLESLK